MTSSIARNAPIAMVQLNTQSKPRARGDARIAMCALLSFRSLSNASNPALQDATRTFLQKMSVEQCLILLGKVSKEETRIKDINTTLVQLGKFTKKQWRRGDQSSSSSSEEESTSASEEDQGAEGKEDASESESERDTAGQHGMTKGGQGLGGV